ncbi:hypothetical protein [Paeniglutamicibacter terrestris]|uniref:Phage tail protein n=1 Tax=Paeniglutamicibacter terrestris TaxID=2723403 RepID=A0ABX1G6F2_9MICC|nr:hypothetical protein [Paeniglutamicibacter terrestris]NKG21110.1 hypothetical protein [Paeniglutamicibacter terrestris]
MGNALNVQVGKPKATGAIFKAPLGTALPVNETTALAAAYVDHGYASSEGLTKAITKAFTEIKEWGGKTVLRPQTEVGVNINFKLIEVVGVTGGVVAKTVFGASAVTVTPATSSTGTKIALAYKGDELPNGVWAFDMVNPSTNALRRVIAANAQVTNEDFTQTYSGESAIEIPVQLTCFPDALGNFFYEYSDDGIFSV